MYSTNQATILNETSFFGKPKNMERVVNVKLLPAEENSGIIFKRMDLKENNIVKFNYENSFIEKNKLVLRNLDGAVINDVAIFLTAIWASRIDNILIEIDGDSIPYIDGTSEPFSFLLTICKIRELDKSRNIFELKQDIGLKIDNFEISIKPNKSFIINIENSNNSFSFDNGILPYKDWLSKVNENSDETAKYNILSTIAIIFLSGMFFLSEINIKNFDKELTYNFFRNLFLNKIK